MPAHPGIQVATAEPNSGPWAVANQNGGQASVIAIDPLCRHAKIGCGLFDGQKGLELGTGLFALGTGRFVRR